ncbi:MAG: hypothetical protein MUF52_01040 [Syntrophobacteraceae bacterium]|nr:hypothetical protein [Syntrophobacteraceae bacterium]
MLRLFHPDMKLVLGSGMLYAPLPLDPDIALEARERVEASRAGPGDMESQPPVLVERDGRPFVLSLSLESLVEGYDRIDGDGYERLRRITLEGLEAPRDLPAAVSPDGRLGTIVFGIMPHFVRKGGGLRRGPLTDEAFLEFLWTRLNVPGACLEEADRILDAAPVRERLKGLSGLEQEVEGLEDGPLDGEALKRWLQGALRGLIVRRERARLEGELRARGQWGESKRKHVAVMLHLAQGGALELDGFGFTRVGSREDYVIYKRTGEFILEDYYGQKYRFPDCRVAVSTAGPLRPVVLESYKHPFLRHHLPGQEICLGGYLWPGEPTAESIIRLLEDGINALLHGYDARRRNGYHSLDKTLYYVKSITFEDYRV